MRTFAKLFSASAALSAIVLSGCSSSNSFTPASPSGGISPAQAARAAQLASFIRPRGKQIVVKPGQSIQKAVDAAQPGDTVVVEPGTYHETGRTCPFNGQELCAVSVTADDITIVGQSSAKPVVLDNPTKKLAIGIGYGKSYQQCSTASQINGSYVVGMTVKNFTDSGIYLNCVKNWEWAYDTGINNKIYDFYPVWASYGRLDNNFASGATDTGFYVGISDHVRVDHNVATDNVSGYEFENTIDSVMEYNTGYNNTGGILEFIIPGDPLERSYGNIVRYNNVNGNNNANKCTSGYVCTVPPGTGILDIGGTDNQFVGNMANNNISYGIALTDVCTAFTMTPAQCKKLKYDPYPEKNQFKGNTTMYNAIDLAWDPQTGKGNCWSKNASLVTLPVKLPHC